MEAIFSSPLKLQPLYQTRVWGGRRLATMLGKSLPDPDQPYGEAWEVSDRPDAVSVVCGSGTQPLTLHDLWMRYRREVFGESAERCESARFPLLMKILDAQDDLSLQVHPPAAVAAELGGEPKTEMWYIAHADPGAKIYAGLKRGVTEADFEEALAAGSAADCVHVLEARAGDCLFLPSGRLHAIGAGLLIYEIQQNSDTTYRVFDWNRLGLDGKPRQLHVAESLRSIDFQDVEPAMQNRAADGTLVSCEYFDVKLKQPATASCLGADAEHLTFAVISGSFSLGGRTWRAGDFGLIPAVLPLDRRTVSEATPNAAWLEIRLP
jgi:mannose-6-phosphate isomerase